MHGRGRATTALERFDRALFVLRRGGTGVLWPAWLGGLGVAAGAMLVYYLEIVEGVRSLRPVLALLLAGAWWARAAAQAVATRRAVRWLWPEASLRLQPGGPLAVTRLASVVGLGLWVWLWVLVVASFLGPVAVVGALPLLALRGAVAPSWLARAGCEPAGGLRAFREAVADGAGQRGTGLLVEAMVLVGEVVWFVNLYLCLGLVASFGRSLLGLDVTLIDAFLSPENPFAWLVVGSLTLVLAEPLRAAVSAVFYLEARFRREGLDLRATVDGALGVAGSGPESGAREVAGSGAPRSAALVPLVVVALASVPGVAVGQAPGSEAGPASEPAPASPAGAPTAEGSPSSSGSTALDRRVRSDVQRILERPEFREFEGERSLGVEELLRRLAEKLSDWLELEQRDEDARASPPPFLPLPPAEIFLVLGGALLALVLGYVLAARLRDAREASGEPSRDKTPDDPRDRPPSAHLDDAAALAAQGRYREALRGLYLATLVALDRRGQIAFDPTRTNGHYMRQLPAGELRDGFGRFTRLFDHKWYGEEPTTGEDYGRARAIARDLCGVPEGS